MGDKFLTIITVLLLIDTIRVVVYPPQPKSSAAFIMTGFTNDVEAKWKTTLKSTGDSARSFLGLRGSSTEKSNDNTAKDKKDEVEMPREDAHQVANTTALAVKAQGFDLFPRPEDCKEDMLKKIRDSGMDGSGCAGPAYAQSCSHTMLTMKAGGRNPTWLKGYMEQLQKLRTNDDHSFVGIMMGDCGELEKRTSFDSQDGSAKEAALKNPKVLCQRGAMNMEKWNVTVTAASVVSPAMAIPKYHLVDMDAFVYGGGLHDTIKDFVVFSNPDELEGGEVTLARTRYFEFDYEWKGQWEKTTLKPKIRAYDDLGFSCYWAGNSKLWRIDGCWQDSYDFKSWSALACVNRNLAPDLAKQMDTVFTETLKAGKA